MSSGCSDLNNSNGCIVQGFGSLFVSSRSVSCRECGQRLFVFQGDASNNNPLSKQIIA